MHEYSLALSIIESTTKALEGRDVKEVKGIEVGVGEFAMVNMEQLRFGFDAACKDTFLDGAELALTKTPGTVDCMSCGYEGEAKSDKDIFAVTCPQCQGLAVKIIDGRDIVLLRITAEE